MSDKSLLSSLFIPDWARKRIQGSTGSAHRAAAEDQALFSKYATEVLGIKTPEAQFETGVNAFFSAQVNGIEAAFKAAGVITEDLSPEQRNQLQKNLIERLRINQDAQMNKLRVLRDATNTPEILALKKRADGLQQLQVLSAKDPAQLTSKEQAELSKLREIPELTAEEKETLNNVKERDRLAGLVGMTSLSAEAQGFDNRIPGQTPDYTSPAWIRDFAQTTRGHLLSYANTNLEVLDFLQPDKSRPDLFDFVHRLPEEGTEARETLENALKKVQKDSMDTLGEALNTSINNLDSAIREEHKRLKVAIRALAGEASAEAIEPNPAKIKSLQKALQSKDAKGIASSRLTSHGGYSISASQTEDGNVCFTVGLPHTWFSRGYYHGPTNYMAQDMLSLAELVKSTGAKGIKFNINHGGKKIAMRLGREAFQAAVDAGFDPKDIEINIGGATIKEEDLFKEVEEVPGRQPIEHNLRRAPRSRNLAESVEQGLADNQGLRRKRFSEMKRLLEEGREEANRLGAAPPEPVREPPEPAAAETPETPAADAARSATNAARAANAARSTGAATTKRRTAGAATTQPRPAPGGAEEEPSEGGPTPV